MSISASAVTRFGLGGGIWQPHGSYAGKVASPPVFSGTIPDISLTEGDASTDYDLSTYFTGAVSYSIAPAVESGWAFNTTTGVLTVDPTTAATFGPYIVTATNIGGTADSNAFGVTVASAVVEANSGGWWYRYDHELERRKAREEERKRLELKAKSIKDKLDRELVKELQSQAREQERIEDLRRLTKLAAEHKQELKGSVSQVALKAAESAILKQNYSAMERFERELAKAKEEEEFLIQATSIILNS